MILLYTDFGLNGPYVGEMHAAVHLAAYKRKNTVPTDLRVVDLMHDAPRFEPRAAGYLLNALSLRLPDGCFVVAVVDPGVGTARRPVAVETDGRRYIGPDNGLFGPLARRADAAWDITWRPEAMSTSFHGRDLFAPFAARWSVGDRPDCEPIDPASLIGAMDNSTLAQVIYVDGFGNAMTGLPAEQVPRQATLHIGAERLHRAKTFGDVPVGSGFWYANSCGLAEIAVNQGSAARQFGLSIGTPVTMDG